MKTTRLLTVVLVLALLSGAALAGTAARYVGPVNEAPKAIVPPVADGAIGTDRFLTRGVATEGYDRWEFWFELNRDRFLRRALDANRARWGAEGAKRYLPGPATRDALVTSEDVKLRILPVLMSKLRSPDSRERSLAAIALGKAGVAAAFGPLKTMLDKGTPDDRRAAALALGLLREPLAAPALLEFAGRSGISLSERAYGALALGFLGSKEMAPSLRTLLEQSIPWNGAPAEEFQVATVTALGLLADKESLSQICRTLERSTRRAAEVRAAAAIALGRIGDAAALPSLLSALEDNEVEVRRAAAQALGELGAVAARTALCRAYEKDGDVQVRDFAAIALAGMADRTVKDLLLSGLEEKSPRALRGFSALALGLTGDLSLAPRLRLLLERPSDSSLVGAACIGLALLGDSVGIPTIHSIAVDPARDGGLRSYAVLSLAILGDATTQSEIHGLARDSSSADVRRAATLAVGLRPEVGAGPVLLGSLFSETDPFVKGAAISSLSLTPRESVLDAALLAAGEPGFETDTRLDAIAALGVLALRGEASPLEAALAGLNYRSACGAVESLPEIL